MEEDTDLGDVFAIPDLWAASKWLHSLEDHSNSLFSKLEIEFDSNIPITLDPFQSDDVFFNLPELSFGAPSVPQVTTSAAPSEDPINTGHEAESEDGSEVVWILPQEEPGDSLELGDYQGWDEFGDKEFKEPSTAYITEAGQVVFDTAMAAKEDFLDVGNTTHLVVDTKAYIASVLALGQGRNSLLFSWNEDKQSFIQHFPQMRTSGFTGDSLDSFLVMFMDCGIKTKYLQQFVDTIYSKQKSPGQVALADGVAALLATIQSHLQASTALQRSLLLLQSFFQPIHLLLGCFHRVVATAITARNDEAMLSTIFEELLLLENDTGLLKVVILEILSRVSGPWLEFSSEWLGLQKETGIPLSKNGPGKSFVKVENREWVDDQGFIARELDYVLDYDQIPSFIAPEDARAMFEVGKSVRFLRDHHPKHPLAISDVVASVDPPTLKWMYSWQDVSRIESKAIQYEKDLVATIQQFSGNLPPRDQLDQQEFRFELFGRDVSEMGARIIASINDFNKPLVSDLQSHFTKALGDYLSLKKDISQTEDSKFAPPISLTPVLSFNPIISAQARVVNGTCMRLFFYSHNLRQHLSLQREFHLFGNGIFSSRLSHALFDPSLESAERQKGVARSGGVMGLRLGGRDTWPPASSELRLTLMGILTETYVEPQSTERSSSSGYSDRQKSLPGDLSFGVRDMSQEEIDKCMNPDSIEALDFLRLSYKAPAPLESILTPMILYKYDQIFRLLLRVLRMIYVVSALFRDATDRTSRWRGIHPAAHRFRIEACHFISTLSAYFFDTGIGTTWRIFERKLDQVEDRIRDGERLSLGPDEGLDKLRDYHERVLDKIMFALLLRKRQQPVMKLLEGIFTLILDFSKYSGTSALGADGSGENYDVKEMYAVYRKKVVVFIAVCRGLSEKKGYGDRRPSGNSANPQARLFDGDDLAEENTVSHLLSSLEMSDYYSKV